jgi:hypothetical protein
MDNPLDDMILSALGQLEEKWITVVFWGRGRIENVKPTVWGTHVIISGYDANLIIDSAEISEIDVEGRRITINGLVNFSKV